MTLNEFKVIFYWEYAHRLLARVVGLFSILPLIFFTIKFKNNKFYSNKYYLIFLTSLPSRFYWLVYGF